MITLAAAGRLKSGPLKQLVDTYHERFRFPFSLHEIECVKNLPMDKRKQQEGQALLKLASPAQTLVALDEQGKNMTSLEFSSFLRQCQMSLIFFIGSADGLSDEILSKVSIKISFGASTWPHMLVRVLLMEQLYRAQQILAGHSYHRA